MFTRTNAGIGNENLFHDVDFVVYCEGKAVDGEGSSLDEMFWDRIFTESGKSVHCKSMGVSLSCALWPKRSWKGYPT